MRNSVYRVVPAGQQTSNCADRPTLMAKQHHHQIDAKPTRYRKILFRSRLEARFAVVLDNVPNVTGWEYEPITFRLSPQNWAYTPDFRVNCFLKGKKGQFYVEVKPEFPTREYAHILGEMTKTMRHPLLLVIPNFFELYSETRVYHEGKSQPFSPDTCFSNFDAAFRQGAAFRFDLRQE